MDFFCNLNDGITNDWEDRESIGLLGWFSFNSGAIPQVSGRNGIHDVGLKQPNAWGLYDMHGNVWEWCWDFGFEDRGKIRRVTRGGSASMSALWARSAYWSTVFSVSYSSTLYETGFRIIRPLGQ